MNIYMIGSLRNPQVPIVANVLRAAGHDVFDDWYAAGPTADDTWQAYETQRGRDYEAALDGFAAWHVFQYDQTHLYRAEAAVMVMPTGKSGHLEFGFIIGRGKPGYILFDQPPQRWDVMYRFATHVYDDVQRLTAALAVQR